MKTAKEKNTTTRWGKMKQYIISKIKYIKSNLRRFLFIAFTALIIVFGIIMLIMSFTHDYAIGISIVRDINIMLISTTATLLGLYVTAFIFLSDSLKNRSKEDPKILEAVNNIIGQHRNTMLLIVIGAIVTILLQVVCNILLGKPQVDVSIEDMRLSLNSFEWCFFLITAVISLILIVGIVISSSSITDSDNLITKCSDRNLREHQRHLIKGYDDIVKNYEQELEKKLKTNNDEKHNNEIDVKSSSGEELLSDLGKEKYSFEVAYRALQEDKIILASLSKEEREQRETDGFIVALKKEDFIIRLGKLVRFIESVINRICDNNIDKSVLSGDLYNQSIKAGFQLLYTKSTPRQSLDIRDEKRYLDYLKYQIITSKRFKDLPFDNEEVEGAFSLVENQFAGLSYGADTNTKGLVEKILRKRSNFSQHLPEREAHVGSDVIQKESIQKDFICKYKEGMDALIKEFFEYYDDLIGYRDALIRSYQYSNNKQKNKAKAKATNEDENEVVSLEELKILDYAEICKRVLIDRFTSFVKIDKLNLGNSTLDKGWFNYSELTGGNFTHSSLRFVRMENATCRECDFSTCSFILADASNSDFSKSNFSYSDLTGMDLTECNFANAQMDAVVLRDPNLDDYNKYGFQLLLNYICDDDCDKYIEDRDQWFNEMKEVAQRMPNDCKNSATNDDSKMKKKEENIKKHYKLLRDGEAIKEYVFREECGHVKDYSESCWSYSVNPNDKDTNLLLNGESLLRGSAQALNAQMKDFVLYREYHKLKEDFYKKIKVARIEEAESIKLEKEEREKTSVAEDTNSNSSTDNGSSTKEIRERAYGKINFGVAKLDSASFNEVSMKGIDFSYVSMKNASFRNSDLSDGEMYYTHAESVMFHKTNLNKIDAYRSHFSGSNFSEATLVNATLVNCEFAGCNFERALMLNAIITNGSVEEVDNTKIYLEHFLRKKEVEHSNVQQLLEKVVELDAESIDMNCNLKDCDFINAIANNTIVINVNMLRSKFNSASIRNAFFYNVLLHWGTFNDANFANSIFVGASFHQSDLESANFSRVRFFACEFSNANLYNINLISARIEKVLFDETNLATCNLSSARIANCSFNKCNFEKIIFDRETIFEDCIFSGIDFSTAIGLSEVKIKNCIFELDERDGMCTELEIVLSKSHTEQPVSVSLEEGTNGVGDKKLYSTDEI